MLSSKALLSVKYFYSKKYSPAKKELNFVLVDQGIYEVGLKYCQCVLDKDKNIGKLQLDEFLDNILDEVCSKIL